jgi:hypothetical protein
MGKRVSSMLAMAGTMALVAGLSAAPSLAATATTWTVSPGGTVTLAKSGKFTVRDVTTGHSLACGHTTGTARFKSGSGLSGSGIGSVTALSMSDCTGPGGLPVTVKLSHLPWTLSATSYDPSITGGLTTGTISGIHATFSRDGCSATMDGTSASADNGRTQIHYHNTLAKLKIRTQDSNLHFYNVHGCGGLINSGDPITFAIAYLVSPKQTITGS